MIDLHAHILPKMDDGSASIEESIEMLTMMRDSGVTTVVATPHFDMRKDSIERFLKRRAETYQNLMDAIEGMDVPQVLLGAEVLYCGVGLSHVEEIEKLCLGNGRYLLVETLKGVWDSAFVIDMRKLMAEQNITPVIAHVERYIGPRENRKILPILQNEGILIQSNAAMLLQRSTCHKGIKMIKKRRIQLLSSDCHNTTNRKPNLSEAMDVVRDKLGEEDVEKLISRSKKVVFAETIGR